MGMLPAASPRQGPGARLALVAAGQQGAPARADAFQRAMVLAGEDFGGRHQRGLRAGLDRAQHGQHRHQRLAGADIALQQPQHAPRRGQVGVDLGQRVHLRLRRRPAERRQRLRPQRAVARQCPARPVAHPPAHEGERDLPGQQFVIGQPPPRAWRRRRRRGVQQAQRLGEARPFLPRQQRRVVPLRQRRNTLQRLRHRLAQVPGEQPRRQPPHRLDPGQPLRPVGRHDMVGMHHLAAIVELARHQHPRPFRQLCRREALEEHQLGEAAAVGHHRPGRLARAARRVDAHYLRLDRRQRPRHRRGDGGAGAAVDPAFRQMEQQVDHPRPAGGAGDQRRHRRADAAQGGQRLEQRGAETGGNRRWRGWMHGLTLSWPASI